MLRFLQKKSGKRLGNKYILIMQKIGNIVKHINKQGKQNMANTETYDATVKGVKDIHDA